MTRAELDLSAAARARPVIEMHGIGVAYRGQQPPAPAPLNAGTGARPTRGLARLRWRRPARHRMNGRPGAALSGVELTVSAGEFVTLTGPAGAGLSTLLAVAGLVLRPTTGSYFFKGIDTARLGDRDLAALRGREIGLVLDPTVLLPGRPLLDNVLQPLLYASTPARTGRASRARTRRSLAMDCLDRVGLGAMAGAQAGSLSAGERQRAAIARALVTSPRLLLLDDPTVSLDTSGAATVVALLTSLSAEDTTVVVSSRDQLAAAYSSRCVKIGPNGRPGSTGPDRGEPSGEHRTEPSVAR